MNIMQTHETVNPFDALAYEVRGQHVMLDSDLASVYQVTTGALNRAVNRNPERFPEEFSFQLTQPEWDILRCQIGISRSEHGGRRYLPHVFTEHGFVMIATVLNSARAIEASKDVMRAFGRLWHAEEPRKQSFSIEDMLANPQRYVELFSAYAAEHGYLKSPRGESGIAATAGTQVKLSDRA